MHFSAKRQFQGTNATAFSTIESILLPNNFRLIKSEPSRLKMAGRGMQSSKENPVRGATEVVIEARAGQLWLVLGPLMGLWIRRRTIQALEDMLDSAVASAGREHFSS
jgi:hypothetical protein